MSDILNTTLLAEVFVTLFVIMDPPGGIPIFLSLTRGRSLATIKRSAWQAVAVSFGVILVFALFGQAIVHYLHISMAALQCSGGLLLLLVALELLTGKDETPVPGSPQDNVALVPLGTPLLAGPGAIAATMVFTRKADHFADVTAIGLGIIGVHICIWLAFRFSVPVLKVIKESGVQLVTRIAGLLLSAIAVQMVADAVHTFVTDWS